MDPCAFNNLISSVNSIGFSDEQVDTIKTTIHAAGRVSAFQVAQLIKLLSFDDSKLDVAKMAYHYCSSGYCNDRASYASIVGAEFSFSDAKGELNEYIRHH